MIKKHQTFLGIFVLIQILVGASSVQSSVMTHERLRVRNGFKTPEEVIAYYCARDASGFVWSGLLDAERKAFTVWNEAPQQDSFYLARNYEVKPSERIGHDQNRATVAVHYNLIAVSDGHGTQVPPDDPELQVNFDLKRVGGVWKIVKPDYGQIAPVVLISKFGALASPTLQR